MIEEAEKTPATTVWCATATIKKEVIFGESHEIRNGTKHFRGGAKLFVIDAYWGMCNSVTVIGHHRKSGRYIKIDINPKHLENFRLELIYSPTVLSLLHKHFEDKWGRYCESFAKQIITDVPLWKT